MKMMRHRQQSRCSKCSCGAALFVRSFHTAIVLGVPASLIYKESSLLHQCLMEHQHILLGVAYLAMVAWSLTMYFLTCCTDPGYIVLEHRQKREIKPSLNSDDEDDEDENISLNDMENGNNNNEDEENDHGASGHMLPSNNKATFKYRVCDYCEITQPMRAKHCEDCNKCVCKFDHHCPWLEACIGERNHRYFWLFLLSTFCLIIVTIYITWNAVQFRLYWGDWAKTNAILFVDLFILLLSVMVVLGLLGFHSYLMIQGLTTWEAASRERITYLKYLDEDYNPFDEGLCKNLFQFLCACHLRRWEKVYAQQAKSSNGVV